MSGFPLIPGQPPPWLIPFCASCKEGVEKFTLHPLTVEGQMDVEVHCHGQTTGIRLTASDLVRRSTTGVPVIVFKGPLRNLVNAVVAPDDES